MKNKSSGNQKRINNLGTISGCCSQMRAVYRLARQNLPDEAIDPQAARILVDILKTITASIRENELEARISELEKQIKS